MFSPNSYLTLARLTSNTNPGTLLHVIPLFLSLKSFQIVGTGGCPRMADDAPPILKLNIIFNVGDRNEKT
jgi:hypothetical protein